MAIRVVARGTYRGKNEDLKSAILSRVAAFRQAMADHALTVGVPAPREDYLIEQLARTGEDFVVEDAPPDPVVPTPAEQAAIDLEQKRAAAILALREAELSKALLDPNAPQEVRDYAQAMGRKP